MTKFLASVTGPEEAALVLRGGADIIDLKDPARGALASVAPAVVRATVQAVAGARAISAVAGGAACDEVPMQPAAARAAVEAMAEAGADYVKLGIFPGGDAVSCIQALVPLASRVRLVAVLFADRDPDLSLLPVLRDAGFAGAMLDTAGKQAGRLLTHRDLPGLRDFTDQCRGLGLLVGLAGALEPPDVPRLLVLAPDFLGFRGALCGAGDRAGTINPHAVEAIRALIPAQTGGTPGAPDLRLLAARAYAPPPRDPARADRVFVHDLVLKMRVGAYASEHDRPQRVRFTVEAAVARAARPTEGMADVFSYDIITDGIRMLIASGHVAMLETLAERIAAMLLAYPSVLHVMVRLEKLDLGEGVVGCVVERARDGMAA